MTTNTVLTSTRSESDFAELVAVTPSLGFISKNELSGDAIHRDFLTDQRHGGGCREHEALVYSSTEELAAVTLPFMRHGLARGEHVLVILREAGRIVLEQAPSGEDAANVEFADAIAWYRSPKHALNSCSRCLGRPSSARR